MNQPPTACPKCQQAVCICKPETVTAEPFRVSKHDYHRPWKKLYNCVRWHRLRDAILRRDPICKECLRTKPTGPWNPSQVADHVKDHRGNEVMFYDPKNLEGKCKPCHDERTGREHGKGDRNNEPPSGLDGDGRVIDNYGK